MGRGPCFPSIYTHSISWALVGKSTAKKNKNDKNAWYNKLDKACQKIQDWETRGIPIGPDTSGIISEIILCEIDKKLKKYKYIRFIDDYKCFCKTMEEADNFIRDLSCELESYSLTLNTKKTKIMPLPKALNEDWVRKLKQFIDWREINSFNKNKVIGFLDLSSELYRENPSESPIRYAAQVLKNSKYRDFATYRLILRYFLNLCFLFPYFIDICDDLVNTGFHMFPKKRPDIKVILKNALQEMLMEHTKYRRSDVITWSLFLCIKYDIKLNKLDYLTSQILKIKDCIPALLCYLYRKVNLKNISQFKKMISTVNSSEWWLYVYEVSRIEKVKLKDPNMEKLKKEKITFLSSQITSKL